ncbi:MAG: hypothetical protein RIQ47_311 [Bacteroidota bacterium]
MFSSSKFSGARSLISWLTLIIVSVMTIYSCSENQPVTRNMGTEVKNNSINTTDDNEKKALEEKSSTDTCSVDVYLTPHDFNSGNKSVKEKLILQYEYCKMRYSPKVVVKEDTIRKCTVYHQVWPPIIIKAQLFAKRSDKKPYRSLIYQVQKENEDYRIDEKGRVDAL